jgi:hypothetical protein
MRTTQSIGRTYASNLACFGLPKAVIFSSFPQGELISRSPASSRVCSDKCSCRTERVAEWTTLTPVALLYSCLSHVCRAWRISSRQLARDALISLIFSIICRSRRRKRRAGVRLFPRALVGLLRPSALYVLSSSLPPSRVAA